MKKNRNFIDAMKKTSVLAALIAVAGAAQAATPKALLVHPGEFTDRWIDRAAEMQLDTLAIHPTGGGDADRSLAALLRECETPGFRQRVDRACERGLKVEYQVHAGSWLLPRELFKEHPEYFRVGADGKRTPKLNFCAANEDAIKLVGERARLLAKSLYRGGHRHFFWLDDAGGSACHCEKCKALSPSDQQLKILNYILAELKKDDPEATLAYLAYADAIKPPTSVKPADGIFLEYAPIDRKWNAPITENSKVKKADVEALLGFFGKKGSYVLEYWYDNSLFSRWTKPPQKFTPNQPVVALDVAWYEARGFETISSFACFLGPDYEKIWGAPDVGGFTNPVEGEVDVTTIGVKNDGSEDVSEIVNAATERFALYFPPGRYKVSKALQLKHSIRGRGYSRGPFDRRAEVGPDDTRTWLISDLDCADHSKSIIEFGARRNMNVEEINFICKSGENAIRILPGKAGPMTLLSRLGIYELGGTGISVECGGSRPVFIQDVAMWGSRTKYWPGSCGIRVNAWDCRLSNIEVMATQLGIEVNAGYTYGENLHLWTGCMAKGDNKAEWWKGTRAIRMHGGLMTASNFYPDTSFYPIEFANDTCQLDIRGIMYWDDFSEKGCEDHNGALLKCPKGSESQLSIDGGYWGVTGTDAEPSWMAKLYTPGANIRHVTIRTEMSITGKNLDTLCMGQDLPDYEVAYATNAWCKIADFFTVAQTGAAQATFTLEDGAAWTLDFFKGADGAAKFTATPLNPLCGGREFKTVETGGLMKVFFLSSEPFTGRFVTSRMGRYFRPVDHRHLMHHNGKSRWFEVSDK